MTEMDEMKGWVQANAMQSKNPSRGEQVLEALKVFERLEKVMDCGHKKQFSLVQDGKEYCLMCMFETQNDWRNF